jgi:hypothetical protein
MYIIHYISYGAMIMAPMVTMYILCLIDYSKTQHVHNSLDFLGSHDHGSHG